MLEERSRRLWTNVSSAVKAACRGGHSHFEGGGKLLPKLGSIASAGLLSRSSTGKLRLTEERPGKSRSKSREGRYH